MVSRKEIEDVRSSAELLFSTHQVHSALDEMSSRITTVLADTNPLILCVLTGGIITTSNLMVRCDFPMTCDVIHATRYAGNTVGSKLEWINLPRESLKDRTVLVVDDILDEGLTLAAICKYCNQQGAASVFSAVLIEKILPQNKPIQADFVGLQADNRYLFGFGMDYKGYWRNAPGIFACTNEK